ncbi:MAG: CDP-alcohol phosphatidyltransferase family protein [bacterium]
MSDERWNEKIKLLPQDRLYAWTLDRFLPSGLVPNHLTLLRFLLTPIVVYLLYVENYDWGVPLFLFAAWTDTLDGSMARVRRKITEWGIVYDPLADKLLIGSVLFLIVLRHINLYLGFGLLAVESLMIVGGWFMRRRGTVQPANFLGKIKMVAEVFGITLLLMALWLDVSLLVDLSNGTLGVALVVAIASLLTRLY